MDIDHDDTPGTVDKLDVFRLDQIIELLGSVLKRCACEGEAMSVRGKGKEARLAFAVDPHDSGWPFKGVEHDGDSPIARLMQMTGGLDAGARQVDVPELANHLLVVGVLFWFAKDAEEGPTLVSDALWRNIDVAVARERG